MKKNIILALGLAAVMVACDDDYTDWASPQSNGEETTTEFSFSAATVDAIDLAAVDGDSVQIFAPTFVGDGLDQYYTVQLTDDVTLETDSEGRVAVEDLQSTIVSLYGKAPTAREFSGCTVKCYATLDGSMLMAANTEQVDITVAPYASAVIANTYYVIADWCGWSVDGMQAFSHSDEDVYDDPEFTIVFTTTAADQYWKILPETNLVDGDIDWSGEIYGPASNGDASLSGSLVGENAGAGVISTPGTYRMVINMMDCTYTITAVSELTLYYITGNPNSWSSDGNIIAFPQGNNEYNVTAYFPSSWDFKIWPEENLGDWDNMIGCPSEDSTSKPWSGNLITTGVECLTSPTEGYYTCTLDMTNMTYAWTALDTPTEYSAITLSGDFNSWGDTEMTQTGTSHNWCATITLESDGGVKFKANYAWDTNWGTGVTISDDEWYGTGVNNGDNITVPAGTYKVFMNDITGDFAFVAQ